MAEWKKYRIFAARLLVSLKKHERKNNYEACCDSDDLRHDGRVNFLYWKSITMAKTVRPSEAAVRMHRNIINVVILPSQDANSKPRVLAVVRISAAAKEARAAVSSSSTDAMWKHGAAGAT